MNNIVKDVFYNFLKSYGHRFSSGEKAALLDGLNGSWGPILRGFSSEKNETKQYIAKTMQKTKVEKIRSYLEEHDLKVGDLIAFKSHSQACDSCAKSMVGVLVEGIMIRTVCGHVVTINEHQYDGDAYLDTIEKEQTNVYGLGFTNEITE